MNNRCRSFSTRKIFLFVLSFIIAFARLVLHGLIKLLSFNRLEHAAELLHHRVAAVKMVSIYISINHLPAHPRQHKSTIWQAHRLHLLHGRRTNADAPHYICNSSGARTAHPSQKLYPQGATSLLLWFGPHGHPSGAAKSLPWNPSIWSNPDMDLNGTNQVAQSRCRSYRADRSIVYHPLAQIGAGLEFLWDQCPSSSCTSGNDPKSAAQLQANPEAHATKCRRSCLHAWLQWDRRSLLLGNIHLYLKSSRIQTSSGRVAGRSFHSENDTCLDIPRTIWFLPKPLCGLDPPWWTRAPKNVQRSSEPLTNINCVIQVGKSKSTGCFTNSTAQGGGGSFENRKPIWLELWWCNESSVM